MPIASPRFIAAAAVASVLAPSLGVAGDRKDRTPLDSGEFEETAHTLPAGVNRMTLGTAYTRGINDTVQVGSNALGWLAGANANVEYHFLSADAANLSGTVSGSYAWDGGYQFQVAPTFTLGNRDASRLNVTVGYGRYRTSIVLRDGEEPVISEGTNLPIRLSHDLVVGPQNAFRFLFNTDVQSLMDSTPVFTGGAGWIHGADRFRLGLGLVVTNYGIDEIETILATVGVDPNLPSVYPLPYIRMWWRF